VESRKLLAKFFSESISDAELIELKEWLAQSPVNRKVFDLKNELWQETSAKTKADFYQADKAWEDISNKMGIHRSNKVVLFKRTTYVTLIAAACAAFLLALGALGFGILRQDRIYRLMSATTVVEAPQGQRSQVTLPDSTLVTLNSGSRLEYNGLYNMKERTVKLIGEAYFDVQTNPEKPFGVEINNITVLATGTKFNVSCYPDEDRIEATLVEGSISLLFDNHEPVKLKEGQQLVHLEKSNDIIVREIIPDVYLGWKENKLRFEDTPFEEVIIKLRRNYNVDIELLNNELLELKYTGTFIDESVEEIMKMFSLVSPINYKISYRTTENDMTYKKPIIVIWKK